MGISLIHCPGNFFIRKSWYFSSLNIKIGTETIWKKRKFSQKKSQELDFFKYRLVFLFFFASYRLFLKKGYSDRFAVFGKMFGYDKSFLAKQVLWFALSSKNKKKLKFPELWIQLVKIIFLDSKTSKLSKHWKSIPIPSFEHCELKNKGYIKMMKTLFCKI